MGRDHYAREARIETESAPARHARPYEASASGYFQPGMSAPEESIVDRMVRITTISRNTTAVPAMTMRALRAKRYSRDSSRGADAEGVSHTDGTLAEPVRMKSVLTR